MAYLVLGIYSQAFIILAANAVLPPESESESHSVLSDSLRSATPRTILSMEVSVQNTGVGSLSLLQGLFPTQVSRIAGEFFTI